MASALRAAGHRHHSCHVIPGRDHGGVGSGLGDAADPATRLMHAFLADPVPLISYVSAASTARAG